MNQLVNDNIATSEARETTLKTGIAGPLFIELKNEKYIYKKHATKYL